MEPAQKPQEVQVNKRQIDSNSTHHIQREVVWEN